jgi:hypothetical protein
MSVCRLAERGPVWSVARVNVPVDLALVVDVLPDRHSAAKDLGVFNIAGALPFSIAPAILVIGGGS